MSEEVVGGAIALAGVLVGLLIDLLRDARKATADKAAKRWDVEYESLRELSDLVSSFHGMQGPDYEARKARAIALAFRVRDDRVRRAVEPLTAMSGGQERADAIGNTVRVLGEVMRNL